MDVPAPGILGLNSAQQVQEIVIGSGLSYDTMSLTLSASGGSGIPTLNGTGTNLSAQYLTGETNWPFVVRGTNGAMLSGIDTNAAYWNADWIIGPVTPGDTSLNFYNYTGTPGISLKLEPSLGGATIGMPLLVGGTIKATGQATLESQVRFGLNTNFMLSVSNSSTTGPGTTHFGIITNGTSVRSAVTINNTNGNVGIGTASPANTVEVIGSGQTGFVLGRRTDNAAISVALFFDSSSGGYVLQNSSGALRFVNGGSAATPSGGTEIMRLTQAGLLGIGTTTPLAKEHVTNGAAATVTSRYDQSATNSIAQWLSGNTLVGAMETNGFGSYSLQATNELVATGYTNTTGVNMQAMVNATAVSFTVNNRAGTVIYTSPVITGVMPIGLQPGWSVRGASGLAGTVIPGL